MNKKEQRWQLLLNSNIVMKFDDMKNYEIDSIIIHTINNLVGACYLVEIPVPVIVKGLLFVCGGRGAPVGMALGSLVVWLTSGGVTGCGFWLATKVDVMLKSFTSTRK